MATAPMVLEFGSRSGSWFALGLFALMFGVLGFAAAREVRLRTQGTSTALGRLLGLFLFAMPVSLVYVSMISGYYEAEIAGSTIRLRYLFPDMIAEVPLSQSSARIVPAYRGRVRLVIAGPNGTYESTPWMRERVSESLAQLNSRLNPEP